MVKVQKPNPKSLINDVSAKPKNIPFKNSKGKSSKEKGKSIEKAIQKVGKKEVGKEVKSKVGAVITKSKITQQKDKNPVQKDTLVKKVESNSQPLESKVLQKTQKPLKKKKATVEKVEDKKRPLVKKEQKSQPLESKEKQKGQKPQQKKKTTVEKIEDKKQPLVRKEQHQKKSPTVKEIENKKRKQNLEDADKTLKTPLFEQTNFDEDQFKEIVCLENLKKISKALKTQVEKEVSEKKTSIFSDYKYFLNVASYKIPNCPKRMVKLHVKHSLVDPNTDDVVLIVPDLQRGAKVDYEPTIQHYEDLLRENGVNNIKIVPFNQLRNEYTTFEAKRKFANTYDYFLCDGRIVGHAVGFCGKHFQKPRTTLHAVRLDNPKTYKSDIEHALKRTAFKQLHKGDLISIPVGNDRFTTNQVAENVKIVIDQLKRLFPGGYPNIRNIYLKIDIKGTSALPVYVNLAGAPAETPNVIGPREQRMLKLKKQANDILSKFSMSKTGEFVKLNKTQVERKQQIREAKTALLSKDNSEFKPPAKKAKKNEPVKESKSNEKIEYNVDAEGDEVDAEEDKVDTEEEEGDAEEEDSDAEEEDSDVEEEDSDVEEEDSDEE